MVKEIKRVSAKGVTAASFPELPHMDGRPSYHDLEYWGPVFQALSEEDIPMCMHIGQGLFSITMSPDAPMDNQLILATQVSAIAAQDLLFGPALRAYPGLQAVLVGGRDRVDLVLPRPLRPPLHEPGVARPGLRRQAPERAVP